MFTFQALSAGATPLLLPLSHHQAASLAAALHPRNVYCAPGPLRSRQKVFNHMLCVPVIPAFHASVSKVCSSSPGALGPSWRLGLLQGLVVVDRQAPGVACSSDLTAGLEVPRNTRVPQPRRLGDGVQVPADADVALATALDRRVVGRARDGVVILGRGVTVLRYHVWAMSATSCQLGSFRLVSLVCCW